MVNFKKDLEKIDEIISKHKMCKKLTDFFEKSEIDYYCWLNNDDYELDELI